MKILIIDDNKDFTYVLKNKLFAYHYETDIANSLQSAEEHCLVNTYDLILLDLSLPDGDGLLFLKFLRELGKKNPVIIMTGNKDFEVKMDGFKLGADDYMQKPFSIRELDVRMQAVIRRSYGHASSKIIVGGFIIYQNEKKVTYKTKELILGIKEYEVLEYMLMNYPNVITSEELMEHVYDEYSNPFSSALRVAITRLRKKLREACGYDVLCTLRGRGYKICIKKGLNT